MKLFGVSQTLTDRSFIKAILAEFIGMAAFQLLAGDLLVETINDQPNYENRQTAAIVALANGLIYTALGKDSQDRGRNLP